MLCRQCTVAGGAQKQPVGGTREERGIAMQLFAEALSVVGAMLLSLSCGLLLEELLFGGLVRLFFARRPRTTGVTEQRETSAGTGGEKCLR